MDIYIQLKRSSTENNANSHHLNEAELSKLCTLQKHSTLHYIKHCQHVLWMSVSHYTAVSTFFEHQFCITVLSACSVNVSFVSQCCQHVLWMSNLVAYSTKWHYITRNKTLLVHQQQKHSNPFSCPAILLYAKSTKPTLENKKAKEGKRKPGHTKCFPKGVLFTKPNQQDRNPSVLRPPRESCKVVLK